MRNYAQITIYQVRKLVNIGYEDINLLMLSAEKYLYIGCHVISGN